MGESDNGVPGRAEAPKAPKPRRWFTLSKEATVVLSIETLVVIVLGAVGVGSVWYSFKAQASTTEVRVKALEGADERLERVYERAIETVQLSQVNTAAMQVEVVTLKKERGEDRAEREADRKQNAADHAAILGEIRMLARSRETR